MIGTGQQFSYARCQGCRSLVLIDAPADMSPFYPANYYSYQEVEPSRTLTGWKGTLARLRNRSLIFGTGGLGGLLARRRGNWQASEISHWLRHSPVQSLDARVLDVGCGNGLRLCRLHEMGYTQLTGVDPFIPADRQIRPGLEVLKRSFDQVTDRQFDLVIDDGTCTP